MTQVTTKYRQQTNGITSPINDIPFMVNLTGGLVKQLVYPPKWIIANVYSFAVINQWMDVGVPYKDNFLFNITQAIKWK